MASFLLRVLTFLVMTRINLNSKGRHVTITLKPKPLRFCSSLSLITYKLHLDIEFIVEQNIERETCSCDELGMKSSQHT